MQVVPLLENMPQKLLEVVLKGITEPESISLAAIEAALEEAQEAWADDASCIEDPGCSDRCAEEAAEGKLGSCGDAEIIFGDDGARCEDDAAADIILFDDADDCTPATCSAKEGSSGQEDTCSVVEDPYRRYYK